MELHLRMSLNSQLLFLLEVCVHSCLFFVLVFVCFLCWCLFGFFGFVFCLKIDGAQMSLNYQTVVLVGGVCLFLFVFNSCLFYHNFPFSCLFYSFIHVCFIRLFMFVFFSIFISVFFFFCKINRRYRSHSFRINFEKHSLFA